MPTPDQASTELRTALLHALENEDSEALTEVLAGQHPAQIADVLESIPYDQRPVLWDQLSDATRGEVLMELHGDVRHQLLEQTNEPDLLRALAGLEADELADLDDMLPRTTVDALVAGMAPERRARYDAVRAYPNDSAGGLMDADAASVREDVTLKSVLRYLRKLRASLGALPEHMDSVMVIDRGNRYVGMLRLSDVVSLRGDKTVREAMHQEVPGIPVLTPAAKVARLFEDQDLLSAPVINEAGELLGRITVDDVMDVIRTESERDIMSRAGMSQETDMFAPIFSSAGRRAIWLGINLVNAFIAAWVIGLFEESIDKLVALAVLMPVIASMGGVAGNQTLTLVTRGIALDQIGSDNAWRLLGRELTVSLINGAFWSLVVAIVASLWFNSLQLGMVFGLALVLNLLTGATAGTLVPLILQRVGIDPALAGGVILVAATDVFGFAAFLTLATLVLF